MFHAFFKNYIYPVATMSGSIIGVGFLSLPYITLKVGFFAMLCYFVVLTALVTVIHVIFGKVSLATPDFKRWPGFIEFYFGKWPKAIMLVLMSAGTFAIMLVYLIIGSQFLSVMVLPSMGGTTTMYALIYWALASLCIYFGVTAISRVDFMALLLLLCIVVLIFIQGFSEIQLQNIFIAPLATGISDWFLPYGAILFSLWGIGFIPEIEEMVPGRKKSLQRIIILSTLLPAIFYVIFTFLIISISGTQTTESALVGLVDVLGRGLVSVGLLVGVITTFIAFIAQGLLLKKIFQFDVGIKETVAWLLVCITPLICFLLGFRSFIFIISFIGGLLLSVDGILILLMYRKIGGKKIIIYPLLAVFLLGIVYSVIYSFNQL